MSGPYVRGRVLVGDNSWAPPVAHNQSHDSQTSLDLSRGHPTLTPYTFDYYIVLVIALCWLLHHVVSSQASFTKEEGGGGWLDANGRIGVGVRINILHAYLITLRYRTYPLEFHGDLKLVSLETKDNMKSVYNGT